MRFSVGFSSRCSTKSLRQPSSLSVKLNCNKSLFLADDYGEEEERNVTLSRGKYKLSYQFKLMLQ